MVTETVTAKGYKQTEVGLIPEDWDVKKVQEIADVDPENLNGSTSPDYAFKYISLEDVDVGILRSYSEEVFRTAPSRARRKVRQGDVLVSTVRPNLKSHLLIRDDVHNTVCSTGFSVVRSKPSFADPTFVYFHLFADIINRQIESLLTGSSYPAINRGDVKSLLIPCPSLPEQTTIGKALSDVEMLLVNMGALITKKRNIKQGAMQELLTGKKRLPGFSGKLQPISIAKHASLKARIGWQALTTAEYLENGQYYLVTGTDFINGRVNWSTCHFVDEWRYIQDKNIQLRNGDVLLTKDGTIGKVGYVNKLPKPATLNSGVFVIRPLDDSFEPLFLFYILSSQVFFEFLSKITAGSTITHLYQKDFITFEFLAPNRDEQTAIAQILSDMDAEIDELEQKLDKYKMLKQGMMQELLTGKTRLV